MTVEVAPLLATAVAPPLVPVAPWACSPALRLASPRWRLSCKQIKRGTRQSLAGLNGKGVYIDSWMTLLVTASWNIG